jgi:hypothetical protein
MKDVGAGVVRMDSYGGVGKDLGCYADLLGARWAGEGLRSGRLGWRGCLLHRPERRLRVEINIHHPAASDCQEFDLLKCMLKLRYRHAA